MKGPRISSTPSGFCILIDGQVVEDAGVHGVIRHQDVASNLRDALKLSNPEADVALVGLFAMRAR